jgi:hypothetical protein
MVKYVATLGQAGWSLSLVATDFHEIAAVNDDGETANLILKELDPMRTDLHALRD